MRKFFSRVVKINLIFILLYILLQSTNLILRNRVIVFFFIDLISFTVITTISLSIIIVKNLNNEIKLTNNILFKIAKGLTIIITSLILIFGVWFELLAFGFSSKTETLIEINGKKIIKSYHYGGLTDPDEVEPEYYYPVNMFFMKPVDSSETQYDQLGENR